MLDYTTLLAPLDTPLHNDRFVSPEAMADVRRRLTTLCRESWDVLHRDVEDIARQNQEGQGPSIKEVFAHRRDMFLWLFGTTFETANDEGVWE